MDRMILEGLYGKDADENFASERFNRLRQDHLKLFARDAEMFFSAAGRTELGGNHTDHNLGNVVAASISLDTIAAVHRTDDRIQVSPEHLQQFTSLYSSYRNRNYEIRDVFGKRLHLQGSWGWFCGNNPDLCSAGYGSKLQQGNGKIVRGTLLQDNGN